MDKEEQKNRAQITNVDTGIKKEQMQTTWQAVRWAHWLNTQKGKRKKNTGKTAAVQLQAKRQTETENNILSNNFVFFFYSVKLLFLFFKFLRFSFI